VLVAGAAAPAVLASGLRLAQAAIRRRKPVIVVDLTGDPGLPGALAAGCAAVRAPLHVFGAPGSPRYEPRLRPGPEQQAALAAVPWGPGAGPAAAAGASLADVVRQRAVALFTLGGAGPPDAAGLLAGLLAADAAALYACLYRAGIAPDGLCWITECEGADPAALAALVAAGRPTGLAPVLATTAAAPASRLAGQVNAVILHRLADQGLAAELAALTGTTIVPLSRVLAPYGRAGEDGAPAAATEASRAIPLGTMEVPRVQAGALCGLGSGDFVLVTGLDAARAGSGAVTVRARCQTVTGPAPAPAPPPGAGWQT
jgi:hypothetical protein